MSLHLEHVAPPIPDRRFDWCAYNDDDLCCPECAVTVGYGPTELDALLDWAEQEIER